MSKEAFLALDEAAKEEFINNQATEVYEELEIQKFMEKNTELMKIVTDSGDRVANVWWDTILEGPYSLTGESETQIQTLYTLNGEVIAVQALVSSSAIFTDSCDYDEEADAWGDDCTPGSISESFVIGIDGNTIDFGYYAEFND